MLLEQGKLTSGSTWHAAGLVGQLRTSANITQLLGYSVELYKRLEAETGLATGWKMNGGLRLACNAERWTEVKRQATTAHSFGLEMQLLSPTRGAGPVAADGGRRPGRRRLPADRRPGQPVRHHPVAGQGRAHGRRHDLSRTCAVTGFEIDDGPRHARCVTDQRPHRLREGRDLRRAMGAAARRAWPASTCRCVRCSTSISSPRRSRASTPDLPTLRDPDRLTYYKEEVGGLVMGGYEPNPMPWAERRHARATSSSSCSTTTGTISSRSWSWRSAACRRWQTAGVKQLINGPESFTPDGNFILGEAPEMRELLRRRRLQRLRHRLGRRRRHGAGRMGRRRASRRSTSGRSTSAASAAAIATRDWVRTRTLEAYGKHYTMAWPHEEYDSGRPLRRSPLYERLQGAGRRASARSSAGSGRTGSPRAGRGAARRLQLRPAELVRRRRRASTGPAASAVGALRPDLLRQVPAGRPRRRGGAVAGSAPTTSPSRRAA